MSAEPRDEGLCMNCAAPLSNDLLNDAAIFCDGKCEREHLETMADADHEDVELHSDDQNYRGWTR